MADMVKNGSAHIGLTMVLAALKLDGHEPWADWPWIWVVCPIWITAAVWVIGEAAVLLTKAMRNVWTR